MADAIVLRGGSGFDDSQLTATPDKVRKEKRFMDPEVTAYRPELLPRLWQKQ